MMRLAGLGWVLAGCGSPGQGSGPDLVGTWQTNPHQDEWDAGCPDVETWTLTLEEEGAAQLSYEFDFLTFGGDVPPIEECDFAGLLPSTRTQSDRVGFWTRGTLGQRTFVVSGFDQEVRSVWTYDEDGALIEPPVVTWTATTEHIEAQVALGPDDGDPLLLFGGLQMYRLQ